LSEKTEEMEFKAENSVAHMLIKSLQDTIKKLYNIIIALIIVIGIMSYLIYDSQFETESAVLTTDFENNGEILESHNFGGIFFGDEKQIESENKEEDQNKKN
jgi:hypothetical protein